MEDNKIHFGYENWRGLSGKEINFKRIARVAQAFADFLISHSNEKDVLKVAVGYDGRDKSKEFALLFSRILSGNNILVFLSDKISSSPALVCFVKENNLNSGIIITGGRFPFEYNGIKFISSTGGILSKSQLNEIEDFIDKDLIQVDEEKIYQTDIRTKHYEKLEGLVDFNSIKESGITFLIDSMGGAGQQILENLLIINDIKSKTIFKLAESNFSGRNPNPLNRNLHEIISEIKQSENFSFGIATDGDADRVVFVSDTGDLLNDNQTALLLADYLINIKKESGDIIKSFILTEKINKFKLDNQFSEVPVGLRFFSDHLNSKKALVGFEGNGSFFWGNNSPYRDGILSALIFAEMIANSGYKKLSDYLDSKRELLNDIYTGELVADHFKNNILNTLCENPPDKIGKYTLKNIKSYKESNEELNSLKFFFEGEKKWFVIRKSDHYPVLKLYAEGDSEKDVQEILSAGYDLLRE